MTALPARRSVLARLATWLRAPFRRPSTDELDDELAGYVRHLAARHVDRGLSPAEAHRRALAEVGLEQVKEAMRDAYPWHAVETWWRDARYVASWQGCCMESVRWTQGRLAPCASFSQRRPAWLWLIQPGGRRVSIQPSF